MEKDGVRISVSESFRKYFSLYAYRFLSTLAFTLVLLYMVFLTLDANYLSEGSTFGSQGLWDYAKLYGYGAVSKLFTHALSGNWEKIIPKPENIQN